MIDIGHDFTRYPAGRFRTDGKFSGQRFREEWLAPALREGKRLVILLDGTLGYGSSFLEEAFGGLIRNEGFSRRIVLDNLQFVSSDTSLTTEIKSYIENAATVN